MSKVRITKVKSTIEKHHRQKNTIQALGLNKIGSFNEVEHTPAIAGMIAKVQHLVKVEAI